MIYLEFWLSFLQRNIRNLYAKGHMLLKKNPGNQKTSIPKGSDSFSSSLFYHWITYFLSCSWCWFLEYASFVCSETEVFLYVIQALLYWCDKKGVWKLSSKLRWKNQHTINCHELRILTSNNYTEVRTEWQTDPEFAAGICSCIVSSSKGDWNDC